MKDYKALVERVMDELGYPNRTIDPDGKETGSFRVTLAAAQVIHQTVDPEIGILSKPTGNNVDGYSVDCLVDRSTGDHWDVVVDSGLPKSKAGWGYNGKVDVSRWVNPMDLPLVLGGPPPEQPPVVTPPGSGADRIGEVLAQIAELRGTQAALATRLIEGFDRLAAILALVAQAKRQEELCDLTSLRINAQADRLMAKIGEIKPFSLFGKK